MCMVTTVYMFDAEMHMLLTNRYQTHCGLYIINLGVLCIHYKIIMISQDFIVSEVTSLCLIVVFCGSLPSPTNGIVQFSPSVTYQSIAVFSCMVGYRVTEPSSLTCEANGQWSDSPPQCEGKCIFPCACS